MHFANTPFAKARRFYTKALWNASSLFKKINLFIGYIDTVKVKWNTCTLTFYQVCWRRSHMCHSTWRGPEVNIIFLDYLFINLVKMRKEMCNSGSFVLFTSLVWIKQMKMSIEEAFLMCSGRQLEILRSGMCERALTVSKSVHRMMVKLDIWSVWSWWNGHSAWWKLCLKMFNAWWKTWYEWCFLWWWHWKKNWVQFVGLQFCLTK